MAYTLKMKFQTDGDFCWFLMPPGFGYDEGDEFYWFERHFYSSKELRNWTEKYVPALISNLKGENNAVKKVTGILERLEIASKKEGYIDFFERLSGNYDGTDVSLCGEDKERGTIFDLFIPDSLWRKMSSCNFTRDEIITALNLAVEKKWETIKNTLDNE